MMQSKINDLNPYSDYKISGLPWLKLLPVMSHKKLTGELTTKFTKDMKNLISCFSYLSWSE